MGSKRKRIVVLVGVIVAAAVCVVVLWPREREPVYQGKKLSEWLEVYRECLASGRESNDAQRALQQIGSKAVPFLLTRVGYERAWLESKLLNVCVRFPKVPGAQRYISYLVVKRGPSYVEGGQTGFGVLGPLAIDAVPQLEKWASDSQKPARAKRAADALCVMDTNGLAALIRVASNPAAPDRRRILALISFFEGGYGIRACPVGPEFIRLLEDSDSGVAGTAAVMLGDLAVDPKVAVPALTRSLRDPRHEVRLGAAWALARFHQWARPAVPMLTDLCRDPNERVRMVATNTLQDIAPEVLTNGVSGP